MVVLEVAKMLAAVLLQDSNGELEPQAHQECSLANNAKDIAKSHQLHFRLHDDL